MNDLGKITAVKIGDQFGKLIVVGPAPITKSKKSRVMCKCECGREAPVQVGNLIYNNTKSCGKLPCCDRQKNYRYEPGKQAANLIYLNYQSSARQFNREWNLTREDFDRITSSNCYYCGNTPGNKTKDRNGPYYFVYNGIDRQDSNKGYILSNVVPCCVRCNRGKSNMEMREFYMWIKRIYEMNSEGVI